MTQAKLPEDVALVPIKNDQKKEQRDGPTPFFGHFKIITSYLRQIDSNKREETK